MPDLNRILCRRREPLTLSSLPRGSLPLVLADLARAAQGVKGGQRAVFIAPDEAAMRAGGGGCAVLRARSRGDRVPGMGLPAL